MKAPSCWLWWSVCACLIGGSAHATPRDSAQLLVNQGLELEEHRNELAALRRYSDALAMDPSCEGAYLALGNLRMRRNELHEAEDVFEQALMRVPGSAGARLGRAKAHRARGQMTQAAEDLRSALELAAHDGSELEVALLREQVALARERGRPAEELPAWRRLSGVARLRSDGALLREATVQVRAITRFLDDIDPVAAGRFSTDDMRRTLSAMGRRAGP